MSNGRTKPGRLDSFTFRGGQVIFKVGGNRPAPREDKYLYVCKNLLVHPGPDPGEGLG